MVFDESYDRILHSDVNLEKSISEVNLKTIKFLKPKFFFLFPLMFLFGLLRYGIRGFRKMHLYSMARNLGYVLPLFLMFVFQSKLLGHSFEMQEKKI